MTPITDKQREILRHTLGVGRGRMGWRNHFCTGPGSDDYADCEALVLNLADRVPTNAEVKGGRRLKSALISLAAQMATRRGMPAPDDWPGWGPRVPQKLWRAARGECDKAGDQCGEWAYELRKIADAL